MSDAAGNLLWTTPHGRADALLTCRCGDSVRVPLIETYDEDRNCTHAEFDGPDGWYVELLSDGAIVRCPAHRILV